ncbi:MAG: hypothetical protein K6T99_04355 [Armatimonadetes bacterium]|nr:hypothetical protein [Armatimonadota bacterium]
MKNTLASSLVSLLLILTITQTGEAMWKDDLKDSSAWSLSYLVDEKEIGKGIIRADGILHIPMDFRDATTNRLSRDINLMRPRWISFKLRATGNISPENLKLRLCLKSPDAPFSFFPKVKQTSNEWTEFEADINQPDSLVNVWRFYGLRRLSQLSLSIEKPPGNSTFELQLADLTFRYGEDIVENYKPKKMNLKPTQPPTIALCLNRAGEYYQAEEIFRIHFPTARLSTHAFRGPHMPLDNWPPNLSQLSLVVMVDTDTYVLSDRELANLADYVHSGGSLLIFAGPNSVNASLDGRPLAKDILPALPEKHTNDRSELPIIASKIIPAEENKLGYPGPLQEVTLKPDSQVILEDAGGRPVIIVRPFGNGKVALVTCWPDPSIDRGKSLYWSQEYTKVISSLISHLTNLRAEHEKETTIFQPSIRVEFRYHKRVFKPLGTFEFNVHGPAGANVQASLRDIRTRVVWRAAGTLDATGSLKIRDILPDLADGEYTLSVQSKETSTNVPIAIASPLDMNCFYPIIARVPVQQGGHWLGPKTLKWMVEDVASHGINTIAIPVLDAIAREPQGFAAEMAGLLEFYAQQQGMAVMYDYSHLPIFAHKTRPPFDVRSPNAESKAAELLKPWTEVADLVPRLFAVKHIDEPVANYANLNLDFDSGREYLEKCGFNAPDAEQEAPLCGENRLKHWIFVGDYARRQFQLSYNICQKQEKPWGLLHTFMEPGFGSESPQRRFEDVFRWGGTADYLDFDIYPYWYPQSHKRRFAKVHYGFAFQRCVVQFYGKPMGFYVELDDRNWPFQQNPKEATGELAYTAVGEGCHYLNTFIYGVFGAGNMARPERWEDGGADLRAIAKTTPFLLSTERAKAHIALYFPYRQWIINGAYYPTFGLELFRREFGECDILHEEIALDRGFEPYQAVILLQTDILPQKVESTLIEFIRSGGILMLDHCPSITPEGAPLTQLKALVGEMPSAEPWRAETIQVGKGYIIKVPEGLDNTYRLAVEHDDVKTVDMLESWAREVFTNYGILPWAKCSDDEFEASLLIGKNASAVVVVNHRPETATAKISVNPSLKVGYICDLATGKAFKFQKAGENITIPVQLTQRQGAILCLYPKKPGRPEFDVQVANGEFIIRLAEPSGCPIPIFIEAIRPDGRRSFRHTREILLTGTAEFRMPAALNDPLGDWKFRAVIPMLATEVDKTVKLTARD